MIVHDAGQTRPEQPITGESEEEELAAMTSTACRCIRCERVIEPPDFLGDDQRWLICDECLPEFDAEAEARRIASALSASGIPAKMRDRRLTVVVKQPQDSDFPEWAREVRREQLGLTRWNATAARWLRDWQGDVSVLLTGPVGGGKSTLLAARVRDLVLDGLRVVWTSEHDIFDLLRNFDRRAAALRGLQAADLLVIDDLGAVEARGAWRDDYELVFTSRYNAERPIAATSNLDVDRLADTLGERVASRLVEMLDGGDRIFDLRGFDWRTKRPHRAKEG